MADYIYMMESRLSPAQLQVVGQVQEIARSHEMNVYLTGGAVRDIISGFAIRDLDFTVQGNVHKLRKDLENISSKAIGYEIEQIAHEDDPVAVMKAFEKEGWMKILFPAWTTAKVDTAGLTALQKTRQQLTDIGVQSDPAAARMYFLARKMSEKDVHAIQKLLPREHFVEQWRNIEDDAKNLAKQLLSKEYAAPSATWKLLMSTRPELILFLDITTRHSAVEQKIKSFLTKWPQYRQKMPLQKMVEMRITPELPVYQKLLEEMFLMMLDGKLKTEAEIVKYLEPHSPPLPVAPQTPKRRGRGKKKAAAAAAAAASAPTDRAAQPSPARAPESQALVKSKAPKQQAAPTKILAPQVAAEQAAPPKALAKPADKPTKGHIKLEAKKPPAKKTVKAPAIARPKATSAAKKPPGKKRK